MLPCLTLDLASLEGRGHDLCRHGDVLFSFMAIHLSGCAFICYKIP